MQPHQSLVSASNSTQGQLPSRPTDEYFGTGRRISRSSDEDGDEDDDEDDDDRGDSDGDNQNEKSSQPSTKGRRRRVAM
jgi:hypothetical protein